MKIPSLLAGLAVAFSVSVNAAQPPPKPGAPKTEATCLARGGQWVRHGMFPGMYYCIAATTDSQKKCTGSEQCQGDCLAVTDPSTKEVHGQCSSVLPHPAGGCVTYFENGKEVKEPCI
jgi:hypothetical protein